MPIAARVFQGIAERPLGAAPVVGSTIGLGEGRSPGRVEELVVGVVSGESTVAMSSRDLLDDYLLLLPATSVTRDDAGRFVADPDAAVAVPRSVMAGPHA